MASEALHGAFSQRGMRLTEDARLVELARSGSQAAFDELFRRHHRAVHALAYHLTADEDAADDLVQEVFIRVHQHLGRFRADCSPRTWIMRIAVNASLSYRRAQRHRQAEPLEEEAACPGAEARSHPHSEAARQALAGLRPVERALVVLRDVRGHSYEEIGEILRCSVNAVRVRLHRARGKLRNEFERILRESEQV